MRSFRGGIHLYEGKELTENKAISTVSAGKEVVIPLGQHIGAPATPVVQVGDRVLRGQLIAEPSGFVSAAVCSSVSGTVKAITDRTLLRGQGKVIVIENDGEYENAPGVGDKRSLDTLTAEDVKRIVGEAGIVGMGGAGFPTSVKLVPKNPEDIRYILINAAECEPYLTCDYRLMVERPEKLLGGIRVMQKVFPQAVGIIAVEDNKPEAIATLKALAADDPQIRIQPLKTKYPQGGERLILHAVLGIDINSGVLPADVGCVVQNVSTTIAVYDAVCESTPLISRVVTLSGEGMRGMGNFEVPLGTTLTDLFEQTGGLSEKVTKLVAGGPMTGTAFTELCIPVTKTSGGFLAFEEDDVAARPITACIRCGRCVSVCPAMLVPQMLATNAAYGEFDKFEKLHGMECVECGCCSYVCPAYRPLAQNMKLGKQAVAAARRAAAAKK